MDTTPTLFWSRCSVVWKKDQRERDFALGQFKSGSIRTLVATDVAARGLDIKAQQFHGKKVKKERLGPLKATCTHTESLDRLISNQKFMEFSFCSHHLWAAELRFCWGGAGGSELWPTQSGRGHAPKESRSYLLNPCAKKWNAVLERLVEHSHKSSQSACFNT